MSKYQQTEQQKQQIEKAFTFHPASPEQAQRYTLIRDATRVLAEGMCETCPPSRELSLALTKLEEAVMWANAAIARNE